MSKRNDRYKDWLFLLYVDECYPDWLRRLQDSGVQAAISPQHNNDTWGYNDPMLEDPRVGCSPDLGDYPANLFVAGEKKKKHRHIVLRFPGSKSQEQVNDFCVEVFQENPPRPFKCHGIGGAVRYLIHADQPEKEQFRQSSIISVNGFEVDRYFKPTIAQEDELFYSIRNICEEEDFYNFYNLLYYLSNKAQSGDYVEEFRYCRSHVHLISTFVRSRQGARFASSEAAYRDAVIDNLSNISVSILHSHHDVSEKK